jgi:hypothetical protein
MLLYVTVFDCLIMEVESYRLQSYIGQSELEGNKS